MTRPKHKREGDLYLLTRLNKNIRQYDLADKLGVTPQFLGRVEKGMVGLPLIYIKRICQVLKLDKSDVVQARIDDFKEACERALK